MSYKFAVDNRVENDIKEAVKYYEQRVIGLGVKFYNDVKESYAILKRNPHFQNRYKNVCCLPLKKFPYMIHFSIDEINKTVTIHAIISCYQNPESNWL